MKCTRCPAYDNLYNVNCVPVFGNPSSPILFVGEMFGRTECEKGEPFVGKAGKKLNKLFKLIGLNRQDVAICNSLRCYIEGNKTPPKKYLDACFIHLKSDIEKIKPKLVVALGAVAFYQTTGMTKDNFSQFVGKKIFSDKINCDVFVTYHPAAVIYDRNKWDILIEDFRKIPSFIGKESSGVKHFPYRVIRTPQEFQEPFKWLAMSDEIYLDTETTGLNPYKGEVKLLQLSSGVGFVYLIEGHVIPEIIDELKHLLVNRNLKVIGQGFEFDAKWLSVHYGIFPTNWYFDTCLAEYLISGAKNNDLTFLTSKYVPECAGYDKLVKQAGGAHKVLDEETLLQYAADDVGVLSKIKSEQAKLLKKYNREFLFYNIFMPCNKVLTQMSIRGVKYDINKLMEIDRKYEKKANRALKKAMALPSVKACEKHFKTRFNPRSTKQLQWLLYEYYQLPVLKTTKKGNPSVGKNVLKRFAEEYNNEYCIAMELYRAYDALRLNQLSGVIPKLVDNRAHTTYSLHATTTGRSASYDPNLLNLHPEVKPCIVAAKPLDENIPYTQQFFNDNEDWYFVKADMSQLEVRVMAIVYNDPKLIEFCNKEGEDFHSLVSSEVYHEKYEYFKKKVQEKDKEYKEKRKKAKCVPSSTRVLTSKGYKRIEDLVDLSEIEEGEWIKYEDLKVTVGSHFTPKLLLGIYKGKPSRTIKFETEDGYSFEATPEHQILSIKEDGSLIWMKLEDLNINSIVGVALGNRIWNDRFEIPALNNNRLITSQKRWNPLECSPLDIARFLGVFLAEGSLVEDSVRIAVVRDGDFSSKIGDLFYSLFRDRRITKLERKFDNHYVTQDIYSVSSVDLMRWIKLLDCGTLSSNKRIPDCVFSWPYQFQKELLKWYFEGDGTLKRNGNGIEISATSKSHELLKGIQLLLANFGIRCRLFKEDRRWKGRLIPFYVLTLKTSRSKRKFMEEIGFVSKDKHNRYKIETAFDVDTEWIPINLEILKMFDPYIDFGIWKDKLRQCYKRRVKMNKHKLRKILNEINKNKLPTHILNQWIRLKQLVDLNVSWQKVSKIYRNENIRRDLVDISVEFPHCVVYDGILSHQCVTFGIAYGETEEGLSFNLGISKDEAKQFIEKYFEAFPEMEKNIKAIQKFVIKNGYIETLFGLRRIWDDHSPDNHYMLREAVNHPVQGTAWHLCQLAMIDVDKKFIKKGMKARLVMQIHDELIAACPENEIERVKKIMKKVMENINNDFDKLNQVKLKVDINIGKKLG